MDRGMIERFLSITDLIRARGAFRRLSQHDTSRWALTGRFAIEYQCFRHGVPLSVRSLNDIDFVVSAFDHIPATLANDYLIRHIHPSDPPNKTLIQFVDTESALRLDVFRTIDAVMRRAERVDFGSVVSLEDLTARSARLAMSLSEGKPVPPKHVADYLRLVEISDPGKLELAWQDHRKTFDPPTFEDTRALLHQLIPCRPELQVPTVYSKDTTAVCPRCKPVPPFQLAATSTILQILGYC
jgi:hypothetical protein